MTDRTRGLMRGSAFLALAISASIVAGCTSTPTKGMVNPKRSKEYFSESEYGVKASPRVTTQRTRLPRGGGREQVGKPYKVRGVWYYPKEEKNYRKVGRASWYGDAFHGRLTANGEIYDMTHLTAAHPTMPLPSYARVTNTENGASVIVRVNDRGPYANGRIIDLSKRAAELLDYTHAGVAKVKVEYVGRAPLDGQDEQYLMASYRPGNRAPDPSDGLPSGVMIAMNGPAPSASVGAFPGVLADSAARPAAAAVSTASAFGAIDIILPELGPIAPERPVDSFGTPGATLAALSYADDRVERAGDPFAALDAGLTSDRIIASWKKQSSVTAGTLSYGAFVAAGTFATEAEAGDVARELAVLGRPSMEKSTLDGRDWYTLNLYADGRASLDDLLSAAWTHGAPDAIIVRE